MMGQTPFGGIATTGNASGQAVTAVGGTVKFVNPFQAANGANAIVGTAGSGDNSVKADIPNTRMLVQAQSQKATYKITWTATIKSSAAATLTFSVRKNAGVIAPVQNCVSDFLVGNVPQRVTLVAIVDILPADNPGTIANSGDPPSTSFAGAAAELKNMVPLEIYVAVSADATVLNTEGTWLVERIG